MNWKQEGTGPVWVWGGEDAEQMTGLGGGVTWGRAGQTSRAGSGRACEGATWDGPGGAPCTPWLHADGAAKTGTMGHYVWSPSWGGVLRLQGVCVLFLACERAWLSGIPGDKRGQLHLLAWRLGAVCRAPGRPGASGASGEPRRGQVEEGAQPGSFCTLLPLVRCLRPFWVCWPMLRKSPDPDH